MRKRILIRLVVVAMAVSGCAQGAEGQADCAQQVRLDGVRYTGWSATKAQAQRLGDAERASCDDKGPDAKGSYFPDEPESVTVWSFDGYSPDEVLGVRLDRESYIIFVADSVDDGDRDDFIEKLRRAGS